MTMLTTLPGMDVDEKLSFGDVPDRVLDWYAKNARILPWRIGPAERAAGAKPDPYRVWLAEIMLQQTTVVHASAYYRAFTGRWPSVAALAGAADDEIMAAWAGLGYYARARNLLKCARAVVAAGGWPDTTAGLRELPGIGPYTAGAVAALAFGRRAAAVDGNVERVFARLLAAKGPWDEEKARIRNLVEALVPADRPAEFAEGLMDLGATLCSPKRPSCAQCPLQTNCAGYREGDPAHFPIKPVKPARPERNGHVYVMLDGAGCVLTLRRPAAGLLGGMLGLPGSDWVEGGAPAADFPVPGDWRAAGHIRHVFTHFSLELAVWQAVWQADWSGEGRWTRIEEAHGSLPTVFAKALKRAVDTSQ